MKLTFELYWVKNIKRILTKLKKFLKFRYLNYKMLFFEQALHLIKTLKTLYIPIYFINIFFIFLFQIGIGLKKTVMASRHFPPNMDVTSRVMHWPPNIKYLKKEYTFDSIYLKCVYIYKIKSVLKSYKNDNVMLF